MEAGRKCLFYVSQLLFYLPSAFLLTGRSFVTFLREELGVNILLVEYLVEN